MKKLLLFIVIVVLVIFGGIFVWEKFFDKSYLQPEESMQIKLPSQEPNSLSISPSPIPSPFANKWKKYSTNLFSFEYPGVMPDPSFYSSLEREQNDLRSTYIWKVEKLSSGDYRHQLFLSLVGPAENTKNLRVKKWRQQQYKQTQGTSGPSDAEPGITYFKTQIVNHREILISTFIETNSKKPRSMSVYFPTNDGIYTLDIDIQGTLEELNEYQDIIPHIIDTLKIN